MAKQKESLIVRGLYKSYGAHEAVKDLTFHVEEGEIFGLLGPNGAGKSTTLECILGTKRSDSGQIELLGRSPENFTPRFFEEIGVQFQDSRYPDLIRVGELCRMTASLYKTSGPWKELLDLFGLGGMQKKTVPQLSGGEGQKLSVVLALIHSPRFVVLDELTTGLDPQARRDVWQYMNELKKSGLTVLLTSHFMDEVEFLCDRLLIMRDGEEIVSGRVSDIIELSERDNLEEAYLYFTGEENGKNRYIV